MVEKKQIKNIGTLLFLHLCPGLITILVQLLLIRLRMLEGLPNVFILAVAGLIGIVGWELGFLLYLSKKETGSWNFLNILGFKTRLSNGKTILYGVPLFLFLGVCFTVFKPLGTFLSDTLFAFMPQAFQLTESMTGFSKEILFITLLLYLFVLAIIYPIIEEYYFRGFLLARMVWLGKWGILLNTVLFACYHFWSPWLIVTRVVAMLPLYYCTVKKDSLKLAIVVHCLANTTDIFPLLGLLRL